MRITAGNFKGRNLNCPKGDLVRPTSSKIRAALFNILYSLGVATQDCKILELFSGSGIMSFEFLSRDAFSSVMIDNSIVSLKFCAENAKILKIQDKVKTIKSDSLEYVLKNDLSSYDIIFF